jgi:hypothetical protein
MRLQSRDTFTRSPSQSLVIRAGDVMTEISKTRKQNPRGAPPAVVEAPSQSLEYPDSADTSRGHERAHGQGGALSAKPSGEPPGSPSYYGQRPQQASERGVQETSGSYTRPGTSSPAPALKAIGEPPGSPSYYGEVPRHEGSRPGAPYAKTGTQPGARAVPIGDPPGSPSYFGNSAPQPTGRRAPQSPSQYGQIQTTPRAGTVKPIGEPPGSAQYFGRSGNAPSEGPSGHHRQVPMPQRTSAPQYSPAQQPSGVRAPHAAQTFASVGLPPGSAAYTGRMRRSGPGAG